MMWLKVTLAFVFYDYFMGSLSGKIMLCIMMSYISFKQNEKKSSNFYQQTLHI